MVRTLLKRLQVTQAVTNYCKRSFAPAQSQLSTPPTTTTTTTTANGHNNNGVFVNPFNPTNHKNGTNTSKTTLTNAPNHTNTTNTKNGTNIKNNELNGKPVLDLADFMRYEHFNNANNVQNSSNTSQTSNTTNISFSGLKIEPLQYELFSKSKISDILCSKLKFNHPFHSNKEILDRYIAASSILPMRTNNYVVDNLIDWDDIPNDPIFQLTFPQPEMLDNETIDTMVALISRNNVSKLEIREMAEKIRNTMNPHPAKQKQLNVPLLEGEDMPGMQHKYRETCLFFATEAQYCHAFCTYCFRWAQFTSVGDKEQQFASKDAEKLLNYLREHKCITDVLFTGGDAMVMTSKQFSKYIDPIITNNNNDFDHINTIRIGTKSLAYWPYRFVTDDDSDDILRMFERIVSSGRQVSVMAHFTHSVELTTPVVQEAIRRIRLTGANIRTQSPVIRHVNDDARIWAEKWRVETRLGCIPYYMFVERDTGAKHYFEVPLIKALDIYKDALTMQSGIARTVRGPSMSTTYGKIHVIGVIDVPSQKVSGQMEKAIVLQFLQSRNPEWSKKTFLAKYDESATWIDSLEPFYDNSEWFFSKEMEDLENNSVVSSGQAFDLNVPLKDLVVDRGLKTNALQL